MPAFVERVAAEAVQVRPLKVLLTLLAVPFYVLGLLIGAVVVVFLFAVAAARVGIADVRARASVADGSGG